MQTVSIDISKLKPDPKNARQHGARNLQAIQDSLQTFGQQKPIIIGPKGVVVAGSGTLAAARSLGWKTLDCVKTKLRAKDAKAYAIADNRTAELAEWDQPELADTLKELQLDEKFDHLVAGFTDQEINKLMGGVEEWGNLTDEFGAPPFSVLNARQGWWQKRKKVWVALGIQSELGRDGNLAYGKTSQPPAVHKMKEAYDQAQGVKSSWDDFLAKHPDATVQKGTSIFDPVLCELMYRWFSPAGGTVLDPFAGGSVRGVVAAKLGRDYVGVDLSSDQVLANRKQWEDDMAGAQADGQPQWLHGDSFVLNDLVKGKADMVLTCPPYFDLENYSDNISDLSSMDPDTFRNVYATIIRRAADLLKANRFCVIVVGEVRGKDGKYLNLVSSTVEMCHQAGLDFYDDIVLLTPIGSTASSAGRTFRASRKVGKIHQNVLVFVKGDPAKACKACGDPGSSVDMDPAQVSDD